MMNLYKVLTNQELSPNGVKQIFEMIKAETIAEAERHGIVIIGYYV